MTRPQFHLTAETGWVNDPLGLTYRNGTYHLFFQHVPHVTDWALHCHWGHATSSDLLQWTEQPVALAPGDGDDGCWSGSIVVPPAGDAVLFYTSVQRPTPAVGRVRRARPVDPDWREWAKEDFVADPPPGVGLAAFRDPFVFRDGDGWRMLVGGGMSDGTATAFVYASDDLATWRYTGELARRSTQDTTPVWTGSMWECVQLVSVRGRHVLVVSAWDQDVLHHVAAAVGSYRDGRFAAKSWHQLTYGPAPYAASTYADRDGRVGLIAWLREVADPNAGWAGALSIPTLLDLDAAGRPRLTPHPNTLDARGEPGLEPGEPRADRWPMGSAVDVEWSPRPGARNALLVTTGDGTIIAEVVAAEGAVTLTLAGEKPGEATMPWSGDSVRVLLDGPVLEIFCDGALMAARIDPLHQQVRAMEGDGDGMYRLWRLVAREPQGVPVDHASEDPVGSTGAAQAKAR